MIMLNSETTATLSPQSPDNRLEIFQHYLNSEHIDDLNTGLLAFHKLKQDEQRSLIEHLRLRLNQEMESAYYQSGGSYEKVLKYSTILFAIEPNNLEHLSARSLARYLLAKQTSDLEQAKQFFLLAITDLDTLLAANPDDVWAQDHLADCLLGYSHHQSHAQAINSYQKVVKIWTQVDKKRSNHLFSHAAEWWMLLEYLRLSSVQAYNEIWPVFREHFEEARNKVQGSLLTAWLHQLSSLYCHHPEHQGHQLLEHDLLCLIHLLHHQLKQEDLTWQVDSLRCIGTALISLSQSPFPHASTQILQLSTHVLRKACDENPSDAKCWLFLSRAFEALSEQDQEPQSRIDALQVCMEGATHGVCDFELAQQGARLALILLQEHAALNLAITFWQAASLSRNSTQPEIFLELFRLYAQLNQRNRANAALQAAREHDLLNEFTPQILKHPQQRNLINTALLRLLKSDMAAAEPYRQPIPANNQEDTTTQKLQDVVKTSPEDFDEARFWDAVSAIEANMSNTALQETGTGYQYWLHLRQARLILNAYRLLKAQDKQCRCLNVAFRLFKRAEHLRPGFHIGPLAGCLRISQRAKHHPELAGLQRAKEPLKQELKKHFGQVVEENVLKATIFKGKHFPL